MIDDITTLVCHRGGTDFGALRKLDAKFPTFTISADAASSVIPELLAISKPASGSRGGGSTGGGVVCVVGLHSTVGVLTVVSQIHPSMCR
jgi:hypothetical protein